MTWIIEQQKRLLESNQDTSEVLHFIMSSLQLLKLHEDAFESIEE